MKYNKILVTGGSGMVGRSLKKIMPDAVYISSKDFDLTKESSVKLLFEKHNPDAIIHLAAKVGGIIDNIKKPAEYFTDNILMNTLLMDYAYKNNVKRFISMLSTCIYPDVENLYPMKESQLHNGPPTPTNFSYGYAKRCLAVQTDTYNKQYGTQYQYLTPCNLYGEFDKYGDNSHFIAALIKKIHYSLKNNEKGIVLFGDGTPLRQFMHSDDLAHIIKYCIDNDIYTNMNVATEENLTIKEMASIALKACDAEHLSVHFDSSYPNGQHRKDVSIELLKSTIPSFKPTNLYDGIKKVYKNIVEKNILTD
jgi:GDP-L-fucose synthase